MKKREFVAGIILLSLTVISFNAIASSGGVPFGVKKEEQKKAAPRPPVSAGKPAKEQKTTVEVAPKAVKAPLQVQVDRSLIARKRKEINNTEWEIELIPITGKGKRKEDKIIFSNRKVILKSLAKRGFTPTNFSLNIRSNKKLVWETMQKNDDDIVFFKGEILPDYTKMTGVISFQELRGNKDYSFISSIMREIEPDKFQE